MIAILVNSLAGGGAEKVALTLLEEIYAKGQSTILVCVEKEQGYKPPDFCEVIYLTSFTKLKNPLVKIPWIFISAYRLRKIAQDRNIKFVQSHLIRANLINGASKVLGSKHFAQMVFHTQLRFSHFPPLRTIKKVFYNWLFLRADQIVSISHAMKIRFSNNLNSTSHHPQHVVVPNPHNIGHIQHLANSDIRDFNFDADKRYIISAGRQIRLKKIDLMISALAMVRTQHPEVELIILGEGPAQPYFQQIARQEGLEKHVHFLGYKRNPFAYLSRSDLFVMASESEGLPNIIIEALACGIPVISSDCPTGPREILSPSSDPKDHLTDQLELGQYGVLYPTTREDLLARAITTLIEDEGLRSDYKARGLKYVAKYDQKRITDIYLSHLYSDYSSLTHREIV